ncbi:MAG: DUF2892 domain-containing protein [Saprospiraceae bacterium]|nr:DUF2892 domain-containing protein [Saprospiraceae bacterium]MBX7176561.1 DUF2892 domain-containing protein [Saprospiraceae bacterium]HMW39017.1 DUF2892 domain-containing protein [Saprospiraceae bacterium]HMX87042.1 DUF2892 domain-containing protein [Saprospiraceae bacterium]HMZ41245.1 DUF2892 domain-containing protein [Saprospiraceae bacterium]
MTKNMGFVDKLIRLAAAVLIAILFYANVISGTLAIILGIVAILFVLTSLLGFCPAYFPFGFSTKKKDENSKPK